MDELSSEWNCYQLSSTPEQSSRNWAESLKNVCTVRRVPQLLFLLDEMAKINITSFIDFNFFKCGIMPMWEDPANMNGGRCIIEIPHSKKDAVMNVWKVTALLCSCNAFSTISGCVYNEKANYRISIWVSEEKESNEIIKIWKELVNMPEATFAFTFHNNRGHSDYSRHRKRGMSRR